MLADIRLTADGTAGAVRGVIVLLRHALCLHLTGDAQTAFGTGSNQRSRAVVFMIHERAGLIIRGIAKILVGILKADRTEALVGTSRLVAAVPAGGFTVDEGVILGDVIVIRDDGDIIFAFVAPAGQLKAASCFVLSDIVPLE